MSLHKLSAGTGYTYLTRQVAAHDRTTGPRTSLADYYTEKGETPGRWVGSGLVGVAGIQAGDEVTAAQMQALFGAGLHPLAEQLKNRLEGPDLTERDYRAAGRLGTPYKVYAGDVTTFQVEVARRIEDHAAALGHPRDYPVEHDAKARIRTAVATELFTHQHGRAPSGARELAAAVARYSRPRTRAVGGYDLTFSPVKSVSALWAIAPRAVAAEIERAHHDAVRDALTYLETHALFTREGTDGVRQVETTGLVAAAFTHRDSRAGDPDFHTHVAVANKVQARTSGSWLAIDGRVLFKAHVSASETYNTTLELHLRARLGLRFTARPGTSRGARPVREIVGVDPALLARWSTRRASIETRRGELATRFQRDHGRPPTPVEAIHLAQQATLETRDAKHEPRSLAEQRTSWRAEAEQVLGEPSGVATMLRTVLSPKRSAPSAVVDSAWVDRTAEAVLAQVQARRSTWQVWHVRAEAHRHLRDADLAAAGVDAVVGLVTDAALAASIRLTAGGDGIAEPESLRRSDGSSVYEVAGSTVYSSAAVLAAEQRIVTAAGTAGRHPASEQAVTLALLEQAANGTPLNAGQVALVRGMATSGARVQLAIAPAGSGKTTAMRALTAAWVEDGGTVIGLAPSAAAAAVLREHTGAPTDTLAKLTWTLDHPDHEQPDWVTGINERTLVVIDEAGMADTLSLDTTIRFVLTKGGQVRLIGDTHQLAAIGAGGVLRDIAHTHGALHLSELMRFTDPAEGAASLALRDGLPEALGFYLDHHRIHVGDLATTTEDAFTAWAADLDAGRDTLMLAPTRDLATALNQRAQHHHHAGSPTGHGTPLADGAVGHVGDTVITRRNDRRLRLSSTDWVKNGDRWTIIAVRDDGALTVAHTRTRRRVTLPGDYVRDFVELGYATTIHGAQGVSVDTLHGLATGAEFRQQLYTMLTRGAYANHLYLQTVGDGDPHGVIRPETTHPLTATDILEGVLARDDSPRSATTLQREAVLLGPRLHAATGRYLDALHHAATNHLGAAGVASLEKAADRLVPGIGEDPAWPTLRAHLTLLAATGTDPVHALTDAAQVRELDTAGDRAAVLGWRLDDTGLRNTGPGPLPWLPAIPETLARDPHWGSYLAARRDLVTHLADQVREAAGAGDPAAPSWWPDTASQGDRELRADLAVWRAATGVPETDHRPTGPRHLAKVPALWQRALDTRLGTGSPALAEWGTLLHSLAPAVRGDDFTPHLAQRLAAIHRTGIDAAALLRTAGGAPLPDDHAASALWWRISRHLSPAVAHHLDTSTTLSTDGTDRLTRHLHADHAATLRRSSWWPALVATVDHALARGTRLTDLQAMAADTATLDDWIDPCQALTWRISLLTDPPADDTPPGPEDLTDRERDDAWTPPEPPDCDPPDIGIDVTGAASEDVEARLVAAALVRATMGVLPPSDAEIEQMVAHAAAWDDAPFSPARAAQINTVAADYYARLLDTGWAGDYLRGRLRTAAPPGRAGYAPPGWTHLTDHLHREGVTDEELLAIGLATRARTGRLIDRFRDRLVLPIDCDGITVGFVGRRHPNHGDEHGPKYLNTPTTVLFHKSQVLYGMDHDALGGGAVPVLVEGPLDALAITSATHGRHLGLAPLGTALTQTQARTIAARHRGPIVAFDNDTAGRAAMERAYWLLAQHTTTPRTITLPDGTDPASLMHDAGPAALSRAVDRSHSLTDVLTARALPVEVRAAIIAAGDSALWHPRAEQLAASHNIALLEVRAELAQAVERWNTSPTAVASEQLLTVSEAQGRRNERRKGPAVERSRSGAPRMATYSSHPHPRPISRRPLRQDRPAAR
ncbi:MobF family relaxase [Phycicoccus flavus]|uniref:MobF family relaxase n=1 Tax=Phycicoccus flavus TaxID=2502783 RepID=UPI000FEBC0F2|nr:MobF family relaxase [Phycicoccus flavus]NHA68765.1 relaxase domain-containing protein [Phycicoccus flavus]